MFLGALLVGLQWLSPAALAQAPGGGAGPPARPSIDAILDALQAIESGGCADGGRGATGDGGRAIGPFQIHAAYFRDSGVEGRYQDCRDAEFSRRVVLAYWKRWCPEALERGDAEVLARVHNGGPRGASKRSTLVYWRKVQAWLLAAPARP
jgi:hypothetical protein